MSSQRQASPLAARSVNTQHASAKSGGPKPTAAGAAAPTGVFLTPEVCRLIEENERLLLQRQRLLQAAEEAAKVRRTLAALTGDYTAANDSAEVRAEHARLTAEMAAQEARKRELREAMNAAARDVRGSSAGVRGGGAGAQAAANAGGGAGLEEELRALWAKGGGAGGVAAEARRAWEAAVASAGQARPADRREELRRRVQALRAVPPAVETAAGSSATTQGVAQSLDATNALLLDIMEAYAKCIK